VFIGRNLLKFQEGGANIININESFDPRKLKKGGLSPLKPSRFPLMPVFLRWHFYDILIVIQFINIFKE